MALNVSLDISFDNMREWKDMMGENREVSSTKAYVRNYEIFH
jgi:hypothetical protein